jgi:hypothetical protein
MQATHTTVNRDVTTIASTTFVSYVCDLVLACINGVRICFDKYRIHRQSTINAIVALTRNAVINATMARRIMIVESLRRV